MYLMCIRFQKDVQTIPLSFVNSLYKKIRSDTVRRITIEKMLNSTHDEVDHQ
jgi:hypothetical protein